LSALAELESQVARHRSLDKELAQERKRFQTYSAATEIIVNRVEGERDAASRFRSLSSPPETPELADVRYQVNEFLLDYVRPALMGVKQRADREKERADIAIAEAAVLVEQISTLKVEKEQQIKSFEKAIQELATEKQQKKFIFEELRTIKELLEQSKEEVYNLKRKLTTTDKDIQSRATESIAKDKIIDALESEKDTLQLEKQFIQARFHTQRADSEGRITTLEERIGSLNADKRRQSDAASRMEILQDHRIRELEISQNTAIQLSEKGHRQVGYLQSNIRRLQDVIKGQFLLNQEVSNQR
jgi:hypothetical protein